MKNCSGKSPTALFMNPSAILADPLRRTTSLVVREARKIRALHDERESQDRRELDRSIVTGMNQHLPLGIRSSSNLNASPVSSFPPVSHVSLNYLVYPQSSLSAGSTAMVSCVGG